MDRLRGLMTRDRIKINGEEYQITSKNEIMDMDISDGKIVDGGIRFGLSKDNETYSLVLIDQQIEYKLEATMEGPAPLNPFEDAIYLQKEDKTEKYSITRHQKKPEIKLFKGENPVEIENLEI